ncbi:MAG: type II secretion system protein [Planctomycetes bacterium]|nr:type II secretion system protein [Planctomycetota bacterium]
MMIGTRRKNGQEGMTLLEVMVAFIILTASAVPLLIALADSQRRVADSQVKRRMKQMLEYKLSHVLLDRPAEDQEPIYVDGAEGNFGQEFANADDKSYWSEEDMFFYSYRIDSEEIDLGLSGGVTGSEEETRPPDPEPDPGGDPLGIGAAEEEDLGQLRYRVTLTIFYRPGNANFDQHLSTVVYVKHPHQSEQMTGPELEGGAGNLMGAGEATGGAGTPMSGAGGPPGDGNSFQQASTSNSSGSRDR